MFFDVVAARRSPGRHRACTLRPGHALCSRIATDISVNQLRQLLRFRPCLQWERGRRLLPIERQKTHVPRSSNSDPAPGIGRRSVLVGPPQRARPARGLVVLSQSQGPRRRSLCVRRSVCRELQSRLGAAEQHPHRARPGRTRRDDLEPVRAVGRARNAEELTLPAGLITSGGAISTGPGDLSNCRSGGQGHFWSRIDICRGRTMGCLMSHGSPLPAGSLRLSVNTCGTPRGSSTSNSYTGCPFSRWG
jgi:hypothetical protein